MGVSDSQQESNIALALFGAIHGIVALALDNSLGGRFKSELESQISLMVELAADGIAATADRPLATSER